MFNVFFSSVIDYLKLMYFAPPTTFELRKFNYNTLHIEKVICIPPTFNGHVLFEFPLVNNLDGHYGQMPKWIESTTIIFSARLRRPISTIISTLLFVGQGAWVI
jgi:hypothetical protein